MKTRSHRVSIAAGAIFALFTAALVASGAPPASGVTGPYVAYQDMADASNLRVANPDGAQPTRLLPAGTSVAGYAVSEDGSAFVAGVVNGTLAASNKNNATFALIMSRGGVTREIATYWDAEPRISPDGVHAWFDMGGDIFRYDWATNQTTQLTSGAPLANGNGPKSTMYVENITVRSDGWYAAAEWAAFNTSGNETSSAVVVYDLTNGGAKTWTSTVFTNVGPAVALAAKPFWQFRSPTQPGDGLFFSLCSNTSCSTWTAQEWTGGSAGDAYSAVPSLDSTYDVRPLSGTWFEWQDTGSAPNTTSSYATVSDLTSTPTQWTPRSDGATTRDYQPTLARPQAFTAVASKASIAANLFMSASVDWTGTRFVYAAYGNFLHPIAGQTLANDGAEIDKGTLLWSTDGKHFKRLTTTSGSTTIAWPGDPKSTGNGRTPVLYRNTWFRWSFAGDEFVKPGLSPVVKITLCPRITLHVSHRSGLVVVAGSATRQRGTIKLMMGTKTLATVRLDAKGRFSFANQRLAHGVYAVVTTADQSWGKTTWQFTV